MSPFRSKAQARWMYATHPEMAKEWAQATPSIKALPARVGKKKTRGASKVGRAFNQFYGGK